MRQSITLTLLLAMMCCMATMPAASADANPMNRKLSSHKDYDDFAFSNAFASAWAQSQSSGFTGDWYPHDNDCEAAASAYSSAGSYSSGNRGHDFAFSQADAFAKAAAGSGSYKKGFKDFCTSFASASSSSFAASGGRKMLDMDRNRYLSQSFANAWSQAQSSGFSSEGPDWYPDYNTCNSAAAAYASSGSYSTGRKGRDFVLSQADAFAKSEAASSGGSYKDGFVRFCSSFASAAASSSSSSGGK